MPKDRSLDLSVTSCDGPTPRPAGAPPNARGVRAVLAAATLASCVCAPGSGVRAQEPGSPCLMGFDSEPTSRPNVLDLRVTRDEAMLDATLFVRLDGAATSYTYVLPHVTIDAASARPSDRGRKSSQPLAIALPAEAGIVDGMFGVLDGTPSNGFACRPTLFGFDDAFLRTADDKVKPRIVSDAEPAIEPVVGALAPLQCAKAVESATVDGNPVQPVYPFAAAALQRTGTVLVRVTVRADGTGHDAIVVKSSGTKELDLVAVDAALRTRYVPKRFRCAPAIGDYVFSASFR